MAGNVTLEKRVTFLPIALTVYLGRSPIGEFSYVFAGFANFFPASLKNHRSKGGIAK